MKFFCLLGRGLDLVRKLVLNLLFYGMLLGGLAFWYFSGVTASSVKSGSVLLLNIEGDVVESNSARLSPSSFRELVASGVAAEDTRLSDIVMALKYAAHDPDIVGVEIRTNGLGKLGLASARTIGKAIDAYREVSGKPVYAWADSYSQAQFAAASHADELSLHPMGMVVLKGLSGASLYWGGLLERLGVGVSVYKAGTFKSAPEVWSRSAPTEENLESQKAWMDVAWDGFAEDLEKGRGLMPGNLRRFMSGLPEKLASGEDPAQLLKEAGLVTDLLTHEAFEQKIAKHFTQTGNPKDLHYVALSDYLNARNTEGAGPGVAVVVAQGEIASGLGTGIDPAELNARIERVAQDPRTKALVLRISSPGGSAIDAESIREKLNTIRGKGLPVIVSMGDVAASGGYWVSLAADRVIADPLSITGSIGVFSIVPDAAGILEKAGVGVAGYRTEELADFGSVIHRPGAAEAAILRAGVDRTYDRFKLLAAEGRHRTLAQIEAVAEGRVWMGSQALEVGLVDGLGDLSDAVKVARRLGGLSADAPVRLFDVEEDGMGWVLSRFLVSSALKAVLPSNVLSLFSEMNKATQVVQGQLLTSGQPLALAGVPDGL